MVCAHASIVLDVNIFMYIDWPVLALQVYHTSFIWISSATHLARPSPATPALCLDPYRGFPPKIPNRCKGNVFVPI